MTDYGISCPPGYHSEGGLHSAACVPNKPPRPPKPTKQQQIESFICRADKYQQLCPDCSKTKMKDCLEDLLRQARELEVPDFQDNCMKWRKAFRNSYKDNVGGCHQCFRKEEVTFTYSFYDGFFMKNVLIGAIEWLGSLYAPTHISPLQHASVRVTTCAGDEIYLDNGWWGDNDHYYFHEDIPYTVRPGSDLE